MIKIFHYGNKIEVILNGYFITVKGHMKLTVILLQKNTTAAISQV